MQPDPETTTAMTMRRVREEWERPLRTRIAALEAAIGAAIAAGTGVQPTEILADALGANTGSRRA